MNILSNIGCALRAITVATVMLTTISTPASAFGGPEQELIDLQAMCSAGDKGACHRLELAHLSIACSHGDGRACRERDLLTFHDRCKGGDKGACVHFGIIIGEDRERRDEWRHSHPELFWW